MTSLRAAFSLLALLCISTYALRMNTHTHCAIAAARPLALITACAVSAVLVLTLTHTAVPMPSHDAHTSTVQSCASVALSGFVSGAPHTACFNADGIRVPINTDCNNDSYNLGGVTAERRLTHPMFTALCD